MCHASCMRTVGTGLGMVCRGSNAVVADTLWKHAGSEVPGIGRPYKVERVNLLYP
jgi:hypothetical protein